VEFKHFQEFDVARKLTDAGRPLKFQAKHNQRRYCLCGFTDVSIDDYLFEDSHGDGGGGMISVKAWTERTYGVVLRYGHLPGIETVPRKDVEKGKKQIVIPLELAQLQGADPVQTRGDPNLTAQEIKITTGGRDGPKIRAERILKVGESIKLLINKADSSMQQLQVSVAPQTTALSEVPAGVYRLTPPMMKTGKGDRIVTGSRGKGGPIDDGSYYESTRDDRFLKPCPKVGRWIVVSFESKRAFSGGGGKGGGGKGVGGKGGSGGKGGGGKGGVGTGGGDDAQQVIRTLTSTLRSTARDLGMDLAEFDDSRDVEFLDGGAQPHDAIERRLDDIVRKHDPRGAPGFVLAIISNNKDQNGKGVKPALDRWSILHAPYIPVICMQVDKAKTKLYDTTFFKLNLAKLNARLGGTNTHARDLITEAVPTMVLGLDVFHSRAGDSARSIAAYVASMNGQCTAYHTALREHEKVGDEKLVDLEEVLEKQLLAYHTAQGHMPHRLVVFRDGIAHTAFAAIGEPEIKSIRRVFERLRISPALLFLVVQKRNLTRLFKRETPNGELFYTNVAPGTAVDVERDANFWLVAHYALQGTARVPSYHVLCNEPNPDPASAAPKLEMEEIVQLTYDLCHGHFKCNRSVSVPAPVYYADLAAGRAANLYGVEGPQGRHGDFLGGNFDEEQSLRLFF
jgi:hypothetical protein